MAQKIVRQLTNIAKERSGKVCAKLGLEGEKIVLSDAEIPAKYRACEKRTKKEQTGRIYIDSKIFICLLSS